MKVVKLSALHTSHLYLQEPFPLQAESTPGHSAARRIKSMKNSNAIVIYKI